MIGFRLRHRARDQIAAAFHLTGREVGDVRVQQGAETRRKIEHCRFYFDADFGSATIMSSSMRAPGDDNWLMHTVVEAGSQSPK